MLLTLTAVAFVVLLLVWQSRFRFRRRVLVNLVDGGAMNGVLWSRGLRYVVLRDVTYMERGAEPADMDGEVLVDRMRVAFVQSVGRR